MNRIVTMTSLVPALAIAISTQVVAQTQSLGATQTAQADVPAAAVTKSKRADAKKAPTVSDLENQLNELKAADQAQIRALQNQVDDLKTQVSQSEQKATLTQERTSAANADFVKQIGDVKKQVSQGSGLTWNGISLYGIVDVGLTYINHGAQITDYGYKTAPYLVSNYSRNAIFSPTDNALSQSRIGLRGTEPLEGDWSAIFQAQVDFNPVSGDLADGLKSATERNGVTCTPTNTINCNLNKTYTDGNLAGQAFSDNLWAGVSHPVYGRLTVGRQLALQNELIAKYDPTGSNAYSIIGYSGTSAGFGRTESARFDNSIVYRNQVGPIRAAVQYKASGSGGGADGAAWEFNLGGDYGGLSVDATYGKIHDAVGASPLSEAQVASLFPAGVVTTTNAPAYGANILSTSLSGTVSDNEGFSIAASYAWDKFKFYGGYENIKLSNPSHPLAAGTSIIGGYVLAFVNNTNYNNHESIDVFWGGTKYSITDKLDVIAAYYQVHQSTFGTNAQLVACATNKLANTNCAGATEAVSGLIDYKLSKRLDVYGGAMYSWVWGGAASGFFVTNAIDPTIGVRFSF